MRLILLNIKDKKLLSAIRVYEPTAYANGIIDSGHFIPNPSGPRVYQQPLFLPSNFGSEGDSSPDKFRAADYSSFADYANSIQSFVDDYIGSPDNPVPFGGREKDLEDLNAWLDDLRAPQYLLLAAPAGRGKSALLVHWKQHLLQTRSDIAVVFLPVSIRYSTNLAGIVFVALTAQLAKLHGETPQDPNTPLTTLIGILANYLSRSLPDGRRLLVILDGVDEAADWKAGPYLFPSNPPKGLRAIVSARLLAGDADANQWLRRLGWNKTYMACSQSLERLSKKGVSEVLERMGFPLASLGKDIDIVNELHHLLHAPQVYRFICNPKTSFS